jgi:hypothetical protein
MTGLIDYWVKVGSSNVQNCSQELFIQKSKKQFDVKFTRKCNKSLFERKTTNGEIVKRSWLCFSPFNGSIFCFVCKLMSKTRSQFTHGGFCDWKHADNRLISHETSKDHLNSVINLAVRSKELNRIDNELIKQSEEVKSYWRNIIKRLISVITFICERGLALRGTNEIVGSPKNGIYLGILELLAEYDNFLKQHIEKHANRGSGHTNYLSSTICEELIEIMGNNVLNEIIVSVKLSKYFSISLDSTPDEGHIDQLTLVFRYIERDTPVERFLVFMPNQGHKAQDMYDGLISFLNKYNLNIKNCRGQSYDNASAMSGKYNGLQSKVLEINKHAFWIPCATHSLNLVGKAAAECCTAAVEFFDFLEQLYVFFTASTKRYELMVIALSLENTKTRIHVPQRVNTTRWSCRSDATKALMLGYKQFKSTLIKIADDLEQTTKTRCDANCLYNQLCTLEIGIYTVFWNNILERVDSTNKLLQDPTLDLNTAVSAIRSLKNFVQSKRDKFDEYEKQGANISETTDYLKHRKRQRNIRLNPIDFHETPEVDLTSSQKFKIQNFLPVIDTFISNLDKRLSAYELVYQRFGFLRKLDQLSNEEIENEATKLVKIYEDDIDEHFGNELIQFKEFYKHFKDENSEFHNISQEHLMYKILINKEVKDCFPNVEIVLRIYLVLMITNSSSERSFSNLKHIKNRLRTSMDGDRLNHLARMSSESDILRKLDFQNVIDNFVQMKSRRVPGI